MMSYCVLASICLLSLATAQTVTRLTSCLTSDNYLLMDCWFTSVKGSSQNCTFITEGKVVASTDEKILVHSSFKARAKASIDEPICRLNLTGLVEDQPRNYSCRIGTKTEPWTQTVEKKKLLTCSAWSVLQQSGVALLLALLTLPPFSELL